MQIQFSDNTGVSTYATAGFAECRPVTAVPVIPLGYVAV